MPCPSYSPLYSLTQDLAQQGGSSIIASMCNLYLKVAPSRVSELKNEWYASVHQPIKAEQYLHIASLLVKSTVPRFLSGSGGRVIISASVATVQLLPQGLQHASLLKLMSIESVMPSSHLIFCRPLLLLPSVFPSIRVFSNESGLRMRWPKYWSFSYNISPSNEHPELISFRLDWLDLLAVQGTLKSLLQHHSSKASILQRSAFFIVQLSSIHDYWKNHSFD